jgi:hypothetical protein
MAYDKKSSWGWSPLSGIDYPAEGKYPPIHGADKNYYKPFTLNPGTYGVPKSKGGNDMQDETKALQVINVEDTKALQVINVEDYAMTPDRVAKQVQLIQQVMAQGMKDGEHFGVIPGTNKPTLLKPGAEKLCLTFRMDPEYDIINQTQDSDFIAYTVKCTLYHAPSGNRLASGIGSCNSRETKYRYRNLEKSTGKPVPKNYWKDRDKEIIGGAGYKPWKNPDDGKWYIATFEKVENENPWDLDNTLIKMACKRALVAATLNATAASDIFTQDLEDMQTNGVSPAKEKPLKKTPKKKKAAPPPDETDTTSNHGTGDQEWLSELNATKKGKLFFVAGQEGVEETELEQICKAYAEGKPFDNDMAHELSENFADAVAAFRGGTL